MRIMIAEDTESVRFALRLAMEYFGHEVVGVACDGEEALAEYERTHPEVVLMDVRMPLIDGLKCTEMLSQMHPEAKVVIVTGGRTTASMAREVGARAVVEKPFEIAELNAVICEAAAAA
ncbi:MAG: Chemotaxis protein CheY [Verrucomicrobiae bacterium]|nr:Chemotaxis protein CheY [Verrucomicrobiae bacterium]